MIFGFAPHVDMRFTWFEKGEPVYLHVSTKVTPARSAVTISLSDGVFSTSRTDSYSDKLWGGTFLAVVPIRVLGEHAPQLLVIRNRPNWLELEIYDFSFGEIEVSPFFSGRSLQPIKWHSRAGQLESVEVFDRSGPRPESLQEAPGRRWEQHVWYSWSRSTCKWTVKSSKWETYNPNREPPGDPIKQPAQYSFYYTPKISGRRKGKPQIRLSSQ
jgi:hypothetical protein